MTDSAITAPVETPPVVTPPVEGAVVPPVEGAVTPPVEGAVTPPVEGAVTPPVVPPVEPDAVTYTDFTLPEGVAKDNPLLAEVTEYAKANKLPQEAAQALVDLGLKQSESFNTRLKEANDSAIEGWKSQSMADTEFGGEKFDENRALAFKTFEAFGTPELKTLLDGSGLGYHPELLRWAVKVGKAMSNDGKIVTGGAKPAAAPFYDKSPTLK